MASFSVEEFIGSGILKGLLPKLLEEGWDDVPTLKIMSSEDMDLLHMTQNQKVGHHYHHHYHCYCYYYLCKSFIIHHLIIQS